MVVLQVLHGQELQVTARRCAATLHGQTASDNSSLESTNDCYAGCQHPRAVSDTAIKTCS
jgi:hypothetical protein